MTEELVDFVLEQTGRPLDRWAVAATLESRGTRDVDARERYGKRDVFELAEEVYARCLEAEHAARAVVSPVHTRRSRAAIAARRYFEGGFFFVPLSLQLGALLFLGYGQWASLDFTGDQASVVAIALAVSFVVTGAFVQAVGFAGPYFAAPGRHRLAARAIGWIVALGAAGLVVAAGILALVNWAAASYGWRDFADGLTYFALAGCVALLSAVLYMLKQYLGMVAGTVVGIAVVGIVLHRTGLGIHGAHWIGLGVTIAIEAAWASVVLMRRAAGTAPELRPARMPPTAVLAALVLPYAAYGAAYYALLFVDRIAAWSAGSHGLPFTFSAAYEVALDWALVSVVPALALLEVVLHALTARLAAAGRTYSVASAAEHNRALRRFYGERLRTIAIVLVVGASVVFGAGELAGHAGITKLDRMFTNHVTLAVYPLALAGYGLLVWALYSSLFLLTLGRPQYVLRSLVPGILVAVAVAVVLSRAVTFWAAAGGLVAGALVFGVLAARNALRVLDAVDYHYFAAY